MNQFMNWLAMGGYSMYVWPAYGLAVAVLVLNLLAVKKQKVTIQKKLQQWFKE